jgi:hypothetical protein
MPGEFLNSSQIGTSHDEAADESMSEIVPSEITNLGIPERGLKPLFRIT